MLRDDCHTSALKEAALESEPTPNVANDIAGENDDCGPVDGPQVLNHVVLAQRKGELLRVSELRPRYSLSFTGT